MKINKAKNSKGFTLVELLAVIVILAVLIMFAMPAVTELMQKAGRASFVTEAQEFAQYLDTAYTMSMMSGSWPENNADKSKITEQFTVDGGNYTYFCNSVKQMVVDQYIKKDISNYSGTIEMFIPASTSSEYKTIYVVTMTNKSYIINGVTSYALGNNSYKSTDNAVGAIYAGTDLTKTQSNGACAINKQGAENNLTKYKEGLEANDWKKASRNQ